MGKRERKEQKQPKINIKKSHSSYFTLPYRGVRKEKNLTFGLNELYFLGAPLKLTVLTPNDQSPGVRCPSSYPGKTGGQREDAPSQIWRRADHGNDHGAATEQGSEDSAPARASCGYTALLETLSDRSQDMRPANLHSLAAGLGLGVILKCLPPRALCGWP